MRRPGIANHPSQSRAVTRIFREDVYKIIFRTHHFVGIEYKSNFYLAFFLRGLVDELL